MTLKTRELSKCCEDEVFVELVNPTIAERLRRQGHKYGVDFKMFEESVFCKQCEGLVKETIFVPDDD